MLWRRTSPTGPWKGLGPVRSHSQSVRVLVIDEGCYIDERQKSTHCSFLDSVLRGTTSWTGCKRNRVKSLNVNPRWDIRVRNFESSSKVDGNKTRAIFSGYVIVSRTRAYGLRTGVTNIFSLLTTTLLFSPSRWNYLRNLQLEVWIRGQSVLLWRENVFFLQGSSSPSPRRSPRFCWSTGSSSLRCWK